VAFVVASLDVGGSEQQMVRLAESLPRHRFAVTFILLSRRGPLAERAERAGAQVLVLGWRRSHSPVKGQPDFWRLVRTLRRGDYDIVDSWLFHAYAIVAMARPLCRVPVLIAGRRGLSHPKRDFGWVERIMDRIARRKVDMIVANSAAVREEVSAFEHLDPARIRVIHNGVDIREPTDAFVRKELRATWGIGPDDVLVGYVANYRNRKGHGTLIRAIAKASRIDPSLRLILVGEGPRRDALEALIVQLGLAGVIRLHGAEPDARDIIGAFDIAVQASESEGLPNAVLEAAAAGLPIVATDAGGTTEILDGGRTGILVPIGDEAAMAEAITRLAGDPELRRRLGDDARAFVASSFGVDRFVDETAALYEELAESKGIRR
jgi:glycosyltransferase involved in cell wall biosynthesis